MRCTRYKGESGEIRKNGKDFRILFPQARTPGDRARDDVLSPRRITEDAKTIHV